MAACIRASSIHLSASTLGHNKQYLPFHREFHIATPHHGFRLRACAIPADSTGSHSVAAAPVVSKPGAAPGAPDYQSSSPSLYTDKPVVWDFYQGLEKVTEPDKGWTDQNGEQDAMLEAHLLLIATLAADRAEMHNIIGIQRDNWNKLFQSTLIAITMTATVLAAMDGHDRSLTFSVPACLMDAVAAGAMLGINKFQPSQLAEEQRTAARLCKKLSNDIQYMLRISAPLRPDAKIYLAESLFKLFAVDKAYPLPLTPIVVEKFPEEIVAPVLSKQPDMAKPEIHDCGEGLNGWEPGMSATLTSLCQLMKESDTVAYLRLAERAKNLNKLCAVGAPLLALSGAVLNAIDGLVASSNLGLLAAVCSTVAAIVTSFAHDAQLGMIFELYRSSLGYFADMDASIHRTLRHPVEKRDNGVLFNQRVAYELGRTPEELPLLSTTDHKTAATLF